MASKVPAYNKTANKSSSKYVGASDRRALPIIAQKENEEDLVCHILERLQLSSTERSRRVARMEMIDKALAGYIALSKDDRKREQDNKASKAPKPTDHNLPLAQAQIDDALTYLMTVFAPEMDIFEAVASADKQAMAQAVTGEINRHGQKGAYYRNLMKFIQNGLRYNLGALTCYWEKYEGIVFIGNAMGLATKQKGTLWQGNKLKSSDMYNFLFDTSVHPVDLPSDGEYFAEVERVTPFRVRKLAQDKQLFGIARFVMEDVGGSRAPSSSDEQTLFYIHPPSVRDDGGPAGHHDWREVFRGAPVKESTPGIELVRFTGWINPSEFGLSPANELQLWRIVLANGKYIAFAGKLEDSHGQLPVVCTTPLEDDLRNEQKSYAEQLIPLQNYASFLLNTDQAATRKKIFGITVYNPHLIAGMDLSKDELIGARIPIRSSAPDFDIDKAFRHYTDGPDTDANLTKLSAVMEIMQKILPTDFLKQVADLERATLYQAAATVQAGNRRHLKTARMISDQAMTPLKFQMVYNLYASVPGIDYVDPVSGQRGTISTAKLIEASIELDIGTGLKGIDRLMQIQIFRDVLNAVIQSQQALQEIDIVLLLNYFTSLAGDRTDLTQFRRQQAPVALGPDGKPIAPGGPGAQGQPAPQPGNPEAGGHAAGGA